MGIASLRSVVCLLLTGACGSAHSSGAPSPESAGSTSTGNAAAGMANTHAEGGLSASAEAGKPSNAEGGRDGVGGTPSSHPPGSQAGQVIPYAHSGTRIDALGLEGDGAVLFWKLRDTKLKSDCSFETSEQGELHCAPMAKAAIMYTDANCGDAVVRANSGVSGDYLSAIKRDSSFWKIQEPGELPIHGPIFEIGEYLANDASSLPKLYEWDDAQSTCLEMAVPYPHGATRNLYRVLARPNSDLVAAEIRTVRLAGGLLLDRVVSSDGAEVSAGLKQGGRRCVVQLDGKCVPVPLADASLWLDAECHERSFTFRPPPPMGQPLYGVDVGADYASHVYQLAPLGTADTLTLYNESTTPCATEVTLTWHELIYGPEKDVTADILGLGRVTFGQGRFRPAWFVGTDAETDAALLVQFARPPQFASLTTLIVPTDTDRVCWIDLTHADQPLCTYDSSSDGFPLTPVKM